ncbi:MAG: Uma2 family endonuclease [Vicinamibacterales bacterium]
MPLPQLKAKLEYADLADTPDDGLRYEILDGELYVTPSPRLTHQRVSRRLQRQLETYFAEPGVGEVFNAPADVVLGRHDVVVPDLVVVTDAAQAADDRAIMGSPVLLVEFLSPSTARRDRTIKSRRYAEHGVPHYWIVDATKQTIECYRLNERQYELVASAKGSARMAHPDFPGLTIEPGVLWK